MSLHSRRELLAMVRPRYGNANRKDKRVILDQFAADAGYQRKYAIALLNRLPVARSVSDEKRPRKTRPRIYDAKVKRRCRLSGR